jgi:phosphonate transport system permease protein
VIGPQAPAPSRLRPLLDQERKRGLRRQLSGLAVLAISLAALYWSDVFAWSRYADALPTMSQLVADSWPPDFSRWRNWGGPLIETLAMSIAGTAIAVSVALPLAFVAARNTSPSSHLVRVVRFGFSALRSVPEILIGALLVAIVGFGALPGVIALSLHSIGMLGKFYSEIIEHADPSPGEAILSQGGTWMHVAWFAILPETFPRLVDITLYRWEHNLRAAMMMGLVGAGGIGLELIVALKLFEYREALALLMLTIALVTVVDTIGAYLRGRFVGRNPSKA